MTELERSTSDFMHSLAGDERIDAANISANSTHYGMEVTVYLPEEDREEAKETAYAHGFLEAGVYDPDEEDPRTGDRVLVRYEVVEGYQKTPEEVSIPRETYDVLRPYLSRQAWDYDLPSEVFEAIRTFREVGPEEPVDLPSSLDELVDEAFPGEGD